MTTVLNFSRHPFNTDQRDAIVRLGMQPEDGCRAPFFESAQDFVEQVGSKTVAAVVPGDILRDCWAGEAQIPDNTVIVGWRTDVEARKRGRFAVRGVVIHRWLEGRPVKVADYGIIPTVECDFRTNEVYEFGES